MISIIIPNRGLCFGILIILALAIMYSTLTPDLGNVRIKENSNSKITGNCNNEGIIVDNSNMQIHCVDSKINLEGNSNTRVKLANTNGAIKDSSNGDVDWKGSQLNIQSTSNYKISGGGSTGKCSFSDNSNLKFTGFSNILNCFFERNSNTDVNMNAGGEVKAVGNSNLEIGGIKQDLAVSGVANHRISSVTNENRFHIINQDQQGWFSSIFGSSRSSEPFRPERLRYELDYVDKAVVNGGSYEVGDFKWIMTKDGNEIKLNFNTQGSGELEFKQINPNTLSVSKRSAGQSRAHRVLKVAGPLPLTTPGDNRTVKVPLVSHSNL